MMKPAANGCVLSFHDDPFVATIKASLLNRKLLAFEPFDEFRCSMCMAINQFVRVSALLQNVYGSLNQGKPSTMGKGSNFKNHLISHCIIFKIDATRLD